MKKLFKHRPSAGLVVGFIALCVALGGGAYAASKKKVEYKGLSKDARLKVLGVGSTNAQTGTTPCDPKPGDAFTKCTEIGVNGSTAFPRRYLVVFDGTIDGGTAEAAGICHLEIDGTEINGTKTNVRTANDGRIQGVGINIITTPQGGKHTIAAACRETSGDLKLPQFELSSVMTR
ncbi:MAG TPA: hypothetical protein VH501_09390 [Solirubrobacterales bacterium]|jgi:hypothetical protein